MNLRKFKSKYRNGRRDKEFITTSTGFKRCSKEE
jgi:hypothetical protein